MSEISEKVKAIIVDKLSVSESEVTPEASFTNDLGADSLDTVELIMEFEKVFDITIPINSTFSYDFTLITSIASIRFNILKNVNILFYHLPGLRLILMQKTLENAIRPQV